MGVAPGTLLLARFRVTAERGRQSGAEVYDAIDEQSGEPSRVVLLGGAAAGEDPGILCDRASRYALGCDGIARLLAAGRVGAAGNGVSSRARPVAVAYAARGPRTLDDLIQAAARPDQAEVGRLLAAVARALSPLHEQGVAHASLRPELIAIAGDGVSIEGFGVAQLAQSLGGPTLARDALPVAYRAPEQHGAMPARAETWADVYALGVLATELVAGRAVPEHLDVPTPRAMGLRVGDALEACIAEATSVSVGARPRDVRLWALRLEAALVEPGALPDAVVGQQSTEAPRRVAALEAAEAPAPDATTPVLPGAGEVPGAEVGSDVSGADMGGVSPPAPAAAPPAVEPGASAPAGREPERPVVPPPVSRRRAISRLPAVLAIVGGLLLMVAGVGALFAFALVRGAPPPPAVPAVPLVVPGPRAGPIPWPPAPGAPGAPLPGFAKPGGTSGGLGGVTSSPPPPEPAALPSGRAVHDSSGADVALPVEQDDPVWGRPDAPVTLLVFGDLDCPHTRRSLDVLRRLKARFGEDLRLVWKNRPLGMHPHARDAAEVAVALEAAPGDAAFWKFAVQAAASGQLATVAHLSRWVSAAGGDGRQVSGWLSNPRYSARVDRALKLAGRYDIRATPTFFVNGLRIEGYQPFEVLAAVVQRELSRARALVATGVAAGDVYGDRVRKNFIGSGSAAATRKCPDVAGSPVRGASDALVTIVEYSDFQCPFCKRVQPTLRALLGHYGRDVRLVWKNFPLAFHDRARPAANFAMEAMVRGGSAAFWRVHDRLFAAQPSLGDASLQRIARDAGLAPSPLLAAAREASHAAAIDRDVREGRSFGVSGTPSFFVNGRPLSGALPLARFVSVVGIELAAAKRLVASGTPRRDVYATICGAR